MSFGNRSKAEIIDQLRDILAEAFRLKAAGASGLRLQRANGYADGYMQLLLDAGIVTKRELLDLVSGERARIGGPATVVVTANAA
jgi:hypothetical protein